MLKEDQKEGFHVTILPSGSLAILLNLFTIANTSMGVEIVSPKGVLGSITPNWWSLFHPNPNIAPLTVTMMSWE
jgi:hypothetical protein